ncbi:hypothetical protein RDI58_015006 [Solanum bulbocastanum]|uniref:Uncharacterized protein n=1 Tax=Solanum bulbocastanum TaxID=147425 RepID=A0AAN8TJC5_SOLBU
MEVVLSIFRLLVCIYFICTYINGGCGLYISFVYFACDLYISFVRLYISLVIYKKGKYVQFLYFTF